MELIAAILFILGVWAAISAARQINGKQYGLKQVCVDLSVSCIVLVLSAIIGRAVFGG